MTREANREAATRRWARRGGKISFIFVAPAWSTGRPLTPLVDLPLPTWAVHRSKAEHERVSYIRTCDFIKSFKKWQC
jgi:hypothetical protein